MKSLRQVLRKQVLAICAMVFTADIVAGIILPTFSLYARSLGASLTLIGALTGVSSLTSIASSVPIGMISDTTGRKRVLSAGMLLFSASALLYTVVPNPYWLFPVRVLTGLSMVSTFFMGVAYLGDVVAGRERGLAIGLYTTAMGLGFTIGPAIGGLVAAIYGFRASYRVAALVALAGFIIARRGLAGRPMRAPRADSTTRVALPTRLGLMVNDPDLLAASLANLVNNVVFNTIFSFFPLYAASLSLGEAAIGSMFAVRTLVSTATRVPTGLLTTRFSSWRLMVTALALDTAMLLSIARTTTPLALVILLAGEGIAYGMFLTSGQAFVTGHARDAERGTAIGVYSTAGSTGATLGPFILGVVADAWGLAAVFRATGALVFVGMVALWFVRSRQRRSSLRAAQGRPT